MALKEGDIVLLSLPQSDGVEKNRPVLLLRKLPPFNDFLVCGISSQIKQEVTGFDYVINPESRSFQQTGLRQVSLIRLGFLATVPSNKIPGSIGTIDNSLRRELISRLAKHLLS